MHNAKIENSGRLQRVLACLQSGDERSTLELMQAAHVCAVNSVISELRANGYNISCKRYDGRWYYKMEAQ